MAIELSSASASCTRCGTLFKTRRSNFYASNAPLYKGTGYLSICKRCAESMFDSYLVSTNDARKAMRQVCRKLDLFWRDDIFTYVQERNTQGGIVAAYIARINSRNYVGKCYDDTLSDEGTLWDFTNSDQRTARMKVEERDMRVVSGDVEYIDGVPQEIIDLWGPGYTPDMYAMLEQRRKVWMDKLSTGYELDAGTELLVRQICNLEIIINRDTMEGKPVDKYVNTLNNLLGSAMLKPAQKAGGYEANSNTPFGVWIKRWEDKRPIPESKIKDVDGLIKYICVWFTGHLAKMLGLKKAESALYEREIEKLRVELPEFDDEDDEAFVTDLFSDKPDGDLDE